MHTHLTQGKKGKGKNRSPSSRLGRVCICMYARPLCGRAALALGECLLRQGRLAEAAESLRRAAVRLRRSPAPHVALGRG